MKKKKKQGRPKTKDPRVHRVVVVFNDAEMERLNLLSKSYTNMSAYARERMLA